MFSVYGLDLQPGWPSPLQLSDGLPAGAGKVQARLVLVQTHRESSELFHLVKFVTLAAA